MGWSSGRLEPCHATRAARLGSLSHSSLVIFFWSCWCSFFGGGGDSFRKDHRKILVQSGNFIVGSTRNVFLGTAPSLKFSKSPKVVVDRSLDQIFADSSSISHHTVAAAMASVEALLGALIPQSILGVFGRILGKSYNAQPSFISTPSSCTLAASLTMKINHNSVRIVSPCVSRNLLCILPCDGRGCGKHEYG